MTDRILFGLTVALGLTAVALPLSTHIVWGDVLEALWGALNIVWST